MKALKCINTEIIDGIEHVIIPPDSIPSWLFNLYIQMDTNTQKIYDQLSGDLDEIEAVA